ncbi:hypothetical protein HDK77DRAFT_11010 [Phyllosticta capitalensis]
MYGEEPQPLPTQRASSKVVFHSLQPIHPSSFHHKGQSQGQPKHVSPLRQKQTQSRGVGSGVASFSSYSYKNNSENKKGREKNTHGETHQHHAIPLKGVSTTKEEEEVRSLWAHKRGIKKKRKKKKNWRGPASRPSREKRRGAVFEQRKKEVGKSKFCRVSVSERKEHERSEGQDSLSTGWRTFREARGERRDEAGRGCWKNGRPIFFAMRHAEASQTMIQTTEQPTNRRN